MKKLITIILALGIFFNISLNAQGRFKVRQDQYIQIGYETPTNTSLTFGECAASSYCAANNNGNFAIESMWGGLNFWKPWPTYGAGNFKLFIGASGHIGVGMHPDTNDWGHRLQVNSKVRAYGYDSWSDRRLKENIEPIENALVTVLKLKAVSYNYIPGLDTHKPNYNLDELDEIKRKTIENENYGLDAKFAKDVRIGYIAQDVEKILPEIVETNSSGLKSMNYIDMIPLALEAIKEQQKTIDKLFAELENIKALNQLIKLPKDVGVKATLFQNNPNPFDQTTLITFNIESDFESAQLVVSDFFGESKATHTITNQGEGKYTLHAGSLKSGTYYYSLIINNVIVDTRIMFLIK